MNGVDTGLKMKLGKSGEAYFIRPIDEVAEEGKIDNDGDDNAKCQQLKDNEEEIKHNIGVMPRGLGHAKAFMEEPTLDEVAEMGDFYEDCEKGLAEEDIQKCAEENVEEEEESDSETDSIRSNSQERNNIIQ